MRCPEVRENLAAFLDGEVDGAPRRAMDEHFALCPDCAGERSAQAAVWRLLDLADVPAAPEGFEGRLAERVRTAGAPRGRILGLPRSAAAVVAATVLLAAGGGLLLLDRGGGPVPPSPPTEGTGEEATGGRTEGRETAAAPPEALLEDLAVLEALEVLQDADLDIIDRLSDMEDEDLAVLGG